MCSVNSSILLAVNTVWAPLSVGIITASPNTWLVQMHFYVKNHRLLSLYVKVSLWVAESWLGWKTISASIQQLSRGSPVLQTGHLMLPYEYITIEIQMYAGRNACRSVPFGKEARCVLGTQALCSPGLSSAQLRTWSSLQFKASCTKCSPKHAFQMLHKCQLY